MTKDGLLSEPPIIYKKQAGGLRTHNLAVDACGRATNTIRLVHGRATYGSQTCHIKTTNEPFEDATYPYIWKICQRVTDRRVNYLNHNTTYRHLA